MKLPLLIPPVVALALAGSWLGSQRQKISGLEQESAILQKAIAARSSGSAPDSPQGKPASPAKSAKDKEPIDWKKVAAQFAEMNRGGTNDMRAMIRFSQRLQAMSAEELVAALDEIAALDLPGEAGEMLDLYILNSLVEECPELALTRFIDRLGDDNGSLFYHLSTAIQKWAKKDPAAMIAWFDQQIDTGKFDSKSLDGKSRPRLQFEGALLTELLSSDPAAAGHRLTALPEDHRTEALNHVFFESLKGEDQLAYAELVRNQLPEKDQAQALSRRASSMVDEGSDYSKATAFFDRIQATPAERTACVEKTAESKLFKISLSRKNTREDFDTMREWVGVQAPESIGIVTGKALASAARNQNGRMMEFSEAADLAVEYHDASNNDDVLATFLDGWPARQNKEQARLLAEKISDEKRRAEIIRKLK